MSTLREALPQFALIVALCTSLAMLVSQATYAVAARRPDLAAAGNRMAATLSSSFVAPFTLIVSLLASHMVGELNQAHRNLRQEAEAIVMLRQVSAGLKPAAAAPLQNLLQQYVNEVIELEWPRMLSGGDPQVERTLYALQSKVMAEGSQLPSSIERPLSAAMHQLIEMRGSRLTLATADLPAIVWLALGINGALVMVFLSLLYAQEPATGKLTVGLLAISVATLLAVVFQLDNPYVGGVFIGPDLLRAAIL